MNINVAIDDISHLDELRAEVRAWVNDNFPASLRTKEKQEEYYQSMPKYPTGGDWDLWKQRIVEKRWGAPGWPVELGGGGLDPVEAHAVSQEIIRAGAFNPI